MIAVNDKDLSTVLMLGGAPVRVGLVDECLMLCMADLLVAVGRSTANVTNTLRKVPDMLYFPVSAVDIDGTLANAKVVGVTEEGAVLALARVSKIDLIEVYKVMKWIRKIDSDKLKGA